MANICDKNNKQGKFPQTRTANTLQLRIKQAQGMTTVVWNNNEEQAKKRCTSLSFTEDSAKKKQATDTFIPVSLLSKSYAQVFEPSYRPRRGNSCNSLFLLESWVQKKESYVHNVAPTLAKRV